MEWGRMFPEKVSSIFVPRYVAFYGQILLPRQLPARVAPVEASLADGSVPPLAGDPFELIASWMPLLTALRTRKNSRIRKIRGNVSDSSSIIISSVLPTLRLRIQVLHLAGVLLDKSLARLDLVAHERREQLVGDRCGLDRDLQERPVLRVHRGIPELVRVHLPEALEAADAGVAVGVQARQGLLQLPVVVDVVVLALVRDLVERRLRDVDVAGLDQLRHVPEQEGQHQRPNVAPINVSVGHDDDLVVARLPDVEGLPHPGAYSADHGLYLDVGEDLVDVGLLDVEDLASQRQYRLEVSLPALLGTTARRVALDDVQLAPCRILR